MFYSKKYFHEYNEREEEARRKLDWISGLEPKEESGSKEEEKEKLIQQQHRVARISFMRALRNKQLRTNFLTLFVMWFCAGLTTYCIDLNGEDMTKNLWLGQYMTSILPSILRVCVGFADAKYKWLGRRKLFIMAIGTCTLASIALFVELIIGMKGRLVYFATYLIAYNAVAIHWEPCYMGAAELIPTEVRATSTAFLNVITRAANVLAARTVTLLKGGNEPIIMIIVLISNLISFMTAFFFLKETKGVNLEKVGQMLKLDVPDEEGSRSDRDSMQRKRSKESSASRSDPGEAKDVEKEGVAPDSRDSGEGSGEGEKINTGSRDSEEANLDKGSDRESGHSEKKGSDSAEPVEEQK
ncbi:hypothetical protein Aduo_013373 [Ancylostoma duodenale]